MADDEDLITVAVIARPQGLRGEVIADLQTDFPDRFDDLEDIRLRLSSGLIVERQLEYARLHKSRIVLKLTGIDSVEEAEKLRGAAVVITRSQLVPLPPDSFYDFDLNYLRNKIDRNFEPKLIETVRGRRGDGETNRLRGYKFVTPQEESRLLVESKAS